MVQYYEMYRMVVLLNPSTSYHQYIWFGSQNRDYNRSPTSVGTFDVNGAAHVASRILAAILLASKNGGFNRVLLGSSLQKLDYQ